MAELLVRGVTEIVLRKGVHRGAGGRTVLPGVGVEEVDPTGAGDCFGAAFVSWWLRGMAPQEALRIACACGALALTKRWPMEGAATLTNGERFLAEQCA